MDIVIVAGLTPSASKEGVSHSIYFSEIKVPYTSGATVLPPESNLTIILLESLNPSPSMITFVFPVRGPMAGVML